MAAGADGGKMVALAERIPWTAFDVPAGSRMSTIAVVRRETGGWRWPVFMFTYMTALAYVASLIVYQGGSALGLG